MFDLSKFPKRRWCRKKRRVKKTKSRIQKYADRLNKDVPKSEQWFRAKWEQDMYQEKLDFYQYKYNMPLGKYIPDVINQGYRFVIEIDGSIHDTEMQQWKDKLKDIYYEKRGYKVFRIPAYDDEKYSIMLQAVREHILMKGRRY